MCFGQSHLTNPYRRAPAIVGNRIGRVVLFGNQCGRAKMPLSKNCVHFSNWDGRNMLRVMCPEGKIYGANQPSSYLQLFSRTKSDTTVSGRKHFIITFSPTHPRPATILHISTSSENLTIIPKHKKPRHKPPQQNLPHPIIQHLHKSHQKPFPQPDNHKDRKNSPTIMSPTINSSTTYREKAHTYFNPQTSNYRIHPHQSPPLLAR